MITSTEPEDFKKEFLTVIEKGRKDGPVELCEVATCVKRNFKSMIPLKKPEGSVLRICGQEGTLYKGDEEQLEAWKDFYLPERMEMVVIGVIDDFPCDAFGLQLVLLLGEDGRVFAYEDELLHVVAENLKDLLLHGMVFPGTETFKLGECFEEPTEEEYRKMMESKKVKEIIEIHNQFQKSMEKELLKTMNEIRQRRNDHIDTQERKDAAETPSIPDQRSKENDSPSISKNRKFNGAVSVFPKILNPVY